MNLQQLCIIVMCLLNVVVLAVNCDMCQSDLRFNLYGFNKDAYDCKCGPKAYTCACGPCWTQPDEEGRVLTFAKKQGVCEFSFDCGQCSPPSTPSTAPPNTDEPSVDSPEDNVGTDAPVSAEGNDSIPGAPSMVPRLDPSDGVVAGDPEPSEKVKSTSLLDDLENWQIVLLICSGIMALLTLFGAITCCYCSSAKLSKKENGQSEFGEYQTPQSQNMKSTVPDPYTIRSSSMDPQPSRLSSMDVASTRGIIFPTIYADREQDDKVYHERTKRRPMSLGMEGKSPCISESTLDRADGSIPSSYGREQLLLNNNQPSRGQNRNAPTNDSFASSIEF